MISPYRLRKLLAPTAGLQRAIGLFSLGLIALFLGAGLSFKDIILPVMQWASSVTRRGVNRFVPPGEVSYAMHLLGLFFLLGGSYLVYRGFRSAMNHVLETFNPGLTTGKIDVYVRRQQLAQGPRIVALGGGTGLSTLLRGLKQHSSNITAVVTVTDDGGSSGILVKDKGMIPPGDIRNCLVALSDAEKAMTDLFQHRFKDDSGSLSGHSIGNLFIAGLVDQAKGNFEKAVQIASDILAIRGRVVPATLEHVRLRAELEDGPARRRARRRERDEGVAHIGRSDRSASVEVRDARVDRAERSANPDQRQGAHGDAVAARDDDLAAETIGGGQRVEDAGLVADRHALLGGEERAEIDARRVLDRDPEGGHVLSPRSPRASPQRRDAPGLQAPLRNGT